ncbi:MAG: bZIP transcription factor [Pseudomonas helleri]|uniref:bZIP transcription factor n=1 Tax=Pseudomonas helleri TaxID=1608996 RepID=UPI003FD5EE5B
MEIKKIFKRPSGGEGGFLSWAKFRDLTVVLFCVSLSYRLAVSKISIDLSGFGFTDLLSLILAISAIVLSAAFYFKADESSKNFYNNSYEFTKNISELLGRIEERFGAQLLNIHKGYDDLNSKFGVYPLDVKRGRDEQEREREAVKNSEEQYQKIIDNLMAKAKMSEAEIASMKNRMADLTNEADRAKAELAKNAASWDNEIVNPLSISDGLFGELSELAGMFYDKYHKDANVKVIAKIFNGLVQEGIVEKKTLDELESLGLYSNRSLNARGARLLAHFI